MANVTFKATDDPFFYDVADRTFPGNIEEEILYEGEKDRGATTLSFQQWLSERKRVLAAIRDFPFVYEDVAILPPWEEIRWAMQ